MPADNSVAQSRALVICINYLVVRRAKGGRIIGIIVPPSSQLQNYLLILLYLCATLCQKLACFHFTKYQMLATTTAKIATRIFPHGIGVTPRCLKKIEASVWRQTGERRPRVFLLCSRTRSNGKGIKSLGATELVRRFLSPPLSS